MRISRVVTVCCVSSSVVLLGACGDGGPAGDGTPRGSGAAAADISWLLASAPASSMGVLEAKAGLKEGDSVTLRGIIGGRVDAMSGESAVFVMMDESIDNPCLAEDDHCSTPWDYCCTEQSVLSESGATVQVVDSAGRGIKGDLRDHGIAPLDTVVVVGVVGPRPSGDVLMVRATGVYKAPGS